MTLQSPRIYVYKITFEEVPHYYYGVHKEKRYDEYYMGSPVTHKNYWKIYTPKKEYIKFFDFSDDGYVEAKKFENSLISPVVNESLCLNEHCGGYMSLDICRKSGKIGGQKIHKLGLGIHGRSKEKISEDGRKAGLRSYELKVGVHNRSKEQMHEDGKKAAKKNKENGTAIFGMTPEERIEAGKKGGKISGQKTYKLGIGIHGLSKEEKHEAGKKAAKIQHKQKWQCTITGYISTPCGLSSYQRARGIDTSNRVKIE